MFGKILFILSLIALFGGLIAWVWIGSLGFKIAVSGAIFFAGLFCANEL